LYNDQFHLFIYLFIYLATGWRVQESKPGGSGSPYTFRLAVGSNQPPIKWVPNLFPGDKGPERGINHTPPATAKVKERVELYLLLYGPSWPVLW
jgi:hypothetical protein